MKKKKWTVLLVAALLAVLSACGNGNSSSKEDDNVLHVGATGQSYPFAYKENGKLTGFDVEVMEAVAKKIDMKLDWKLLEFSGLMGELQTGKLDTISNQVAVTDERKEMYHFTEPYAYAGTQIVVKKDNNDIKSVDDLKGKTVAAVLGSNHAKNLESKDPDKKINIKTYETQEGTLKDVAYGRVDAYVNSRTVLMAQIKKTGLPLKLAGDPIVYEQVAFPFAKDDAHDKLRKKVNNALDELRKDGTLKKLSEKYFNEDITVEQKH
ncbi:MULTISPECIES: amino acid ABC transporter substrate-binding protein [Bacillus]|uniref:amino acid ABC transporter substrate-binding protein n=1 Tax=Bacillus TaxID=1386 RepID=UPI001CDC61A8|nr:MULTISPECIES: amino acid ABC transporter substrate-binding protein [Bacillus]MCY7758450.1 amino acid ABC transporter substrate-binding protein [Bacillus inaquosorum]MCY8732404.1 amino acid ABC transporter substrate-binding protein [Bacillus inaquosorum]